MRHWVCIYCGVELMYESAERLQRQSGLHLVDEHLDRVIESFDRYNETGDCHEVAVDGGFEGLAEAEEQLTSACEDCGQNHTLWWAKMQAYRP